MIKMDFIPISEPNIGDKELEYVTDAVKSWWVSSLGYYVEKFEKDFAAYCNAKYGVSVSSGTVALHLALVALKIGVWDEVIVPNLTFAATANAVLYTGANPVLVDVESDTGNINVDFIEQHITSKTKAIIVVHLYGHPCDMDRVNEIAKKYNLFVIEDCAEAHGAEYKGKRVWKFSDISCFSFYGNKIITTGEWGMCLTDDENLNQRMRELRDHGMKKDKRYRHAEIGFNYRMTNLQAAIWCAQLERIDDFIQIKRNNTKLYNELLKNINWITLPIEKGYAKSTYRMYTIFVDKDKLGMDRDTFIKTLKENWIDSRQVFYPLVDMPPYEQFWKKDELKISNQLSYSWLNLPSSTKLTKEKIEFICKTIIEICKK